MKAADRFANPTTAPNQLWQTDFTYLKVIGWGWFLNLHDERRDERHRNIDLCGREGGMDIGRFNLNILNVAKTFGLKQFFGHVLRGDTDAWDLREADGRSFRRRFLRPYFRTANQGGGRGRGEGCE
jgi:hypothetical protein